MAFELIYTSAEKGLKMNSHGFCTVAMTEGMPVNLVERLEGLSGYSEYYSASGAQANDNPVNFQYTRWRVGGRIYPVISRVAFAGFEHTGRTNKLAHHIVLADPAEQSELGPAAVLKMPGLFVENWSGAPQLLSPRTLKMPTRAPAGFATWTELTGDPGWAGAIAQHTAVPEASLTAVVFDPRISGTKLLNLFNEAMALVPPEIRWNVTFSTYLNDLPLETTCRWRCVAPGSPGWRELEKLKRLPSFLQIDLTAGTIPCPPEGELVSAARDGTNPYLFRQAPSKYRTVIPLEPETIDFMEPTGPRKIVGPTPTKRVAVDAAPPDRLFLWVGVGISAAFLGIGLLMWVVLRTSTPSVQPPVAVAPVAPISPPDLTPPSDLTPDSPKPTPAPKPKPPTSRVIPQPSTTVAESSKPPAEKNEPAKSTSSQKPSSAPTPLPAIENIGQRHPTAPASAPAVLEHDFICATPPPPAFDQMGKIWSELKFAGRFSMPNGPWDTLKPEQIKILITVGGRTDGNGTWRLKYNGSVFAIKGKFRDNDVTLLTMNLSTNGDLNSATPSVEEYHSPIFEIFGNGEITLQAMQNQHLVPVLVFHFAGAKEIKEGIVDDKTKIDAGLAGLKDAGLKEDQIDAAISDKQTVLNQDQTELKKLADKKKLSDEDQKKKDQLPSDIASLQNQVSQMKPIQSAIRDRERLNKLLERTTTFYKLNSR